eukprot:402210_1
MGCWFHFCKCLVRKMNELGLTALYRNKHDRTFYKFMRGFLMLPLLPKDLIPKAFDILIQLKHLNVPKEHMDAFDRFVVYMKSTWMDGLYKIKEWCIYNSWIRTN